MTVKKLSAMAGPAQAQAGLFNPNGWIDKSNDLVLCMKVNGAKHQISWKTARLIDDEYSRGLTHGSSLYRRTLKRKFAPLTKPRNIRPRWSPQKKPRNNRQKPMPLSNAPPLVDLVCPLRSPDET